MKNIEDYLRRNILIAGTTRSGKSAFMETFVVELVRKYSPDEARLLIIDPKRVQFSYFNEVPHLLRPVVYEVEAAEAALRDIWQEVLARLRSQQKDSMPTVTVVIDEIAEAMVNNPTVFEELIEKITACSSFSRIYVVLATSRPDGAVILTPRLRTCFPERLIFRIKHPDDAQMLMGDDRATALTQPGSAYWCDIRSNMINLVSVPHIGSEDREAAVRKMVQLK